MTDPQDQKDPVAATGFRIERDERGHFPQSCASCQAALGDYTLVRRDEHPDPNIIVPALHRAEAQVAALREALSVRSQMWHKGFGPPHVSEWKDCMVPSCVEARALLADTPAQSDLHANCRDNEDALRQNTLDLMAEAQAQVAALREFVERVRDDAQDYDLVQDARALLADTPAQPESRPRAYDEEWWFHQLNPQCTECGQAIEAVLVHLGGLKDHEARLADTPAQSEA